MFPPATDIKTVETSKSEAVVALVGSLAFGALIGFSWGIWRIKQDMDENTDEEFDNFQ